MLLNLFVLKTFIGNRKLGDIKDSNDEGKMLDLDTSSFVDDPESKLIIETPKNPD